MTDTCDLQLKITCVKIGLFLCLSLWESEFRMITKRIDPFNLNLLLLCEFFLHTAASFLRGLGLFLQIAASLLRGLGLFLQIAASFLKGLGLSLHTAASFLKGLGLFLQAAGSFLRF